MYEALTARSAQAHQDMASCCNSTGTPTAHVQQGQSYSGDIAAACEQSMPDGMPDLKFSFAKRWLNEPGHEGIGLQSCRLVVSSEDDLMGSSPAVFEARTPWWREPG